MYLSFSTISLCKLCKQPVPAYDNEIADGASSFLDSDTMFWIGGMATDSYNKTYGWHFTDGANFSYYNWEEKEPSGISARPVCIAMMPSGGGGQWSAKYCTGSSSADKCSFACAYPPINAPPTTSAPPNNTTSLCAPKWTYWNGSCYMPSEAHSNLAGLDNSCATMSPNKNGHLASVHSEAENFFIASLTYPKPVLLGVTYESKQWWNLDGTSLDFTKWYTSQPSNLGVNTCVKALQMDPDMTNEWVSILCDTDTYTYVCKYPAF
ncbi:hypothetical protein WR25_08209 [Diploscapter pachys]|uniref:C-type lectin domain-containing protein n=1 Tax=Diploscapter pachys TaxID=2018661 RepID=A0A2A2JDD8_9BILA|nr:hypothetical protein WR25_08209 [Diploscapter pachys]